MGKFDELGDAVRGVIRAFHGSPYDFDRFDSRYIDTGEGAQAFGHGLYFAGNEGVARHYRDMRPGELTLSEEGELANALKRMRELKSLSREIPKSDPRSSALMSEWDKLLSRRRFLEERPGHMYEVQIDHPENKLLDWDAPISRQPKVVQKLFGEFAMDELGDGGRIYRDIATRHGEAFDDDMTGRLANAAASDELLAEGIPGIRYLDKGSRSAGEGTRSYVVFPGAEDSIRILRKFAIPGAIGTGAASMGGDGDQ